jgi:uncharacterized protein YbjT (DUF2867 family)
MDTALVIGAGAGVGSHISRQLAAARYQVSGLARSERSAAALDRAGIRPVRLDLQAATQEQFAAAVHGSQAVFFAAGVGFNAPVAALEAAGEGSTAESNDRTGPACGVTPSRAPSSAPVVARGEATPRPAESWPGK